MNGAFYISTSFNYFLHFYQTFKAFFYRKTGKFPFYNMRKPHKRSDIVKQYRAICFRFFDNSESRTFKFQSKIQNRPLVYIKIPEFSPSADMIGDLRHQKQKQFSDFRCTCQNISHTEYLKRNIVIKYIFINH